MDIYDYERNVSVATTPMGDKVLTMNREILTSIIVALYEAVEHQREDGRNATANRTLELIHALDKEGGGNA